MRVCNLRDLRDYTSTIKNSQHDVMKSRCVRTVVENVDLVYLYRLLQELRRQKEKIIARTLARPGGLLRKLHFSAEFDLAGELSMKRH